MGDDLETERKDDTDFFGSSNHYYKFLKSKTKGRMKSTAAADKHLDEYKT